MSDANEAGSRIPSPKVRTPSSHRTSPTFRPPASLAERCGGDRARTLRAGGSGPRPQSQRSSPQRERTVGGIQQNRKPAANSKGSARITNRNCKKQASVGDEIRRASLAGPDEATVEIEMLGSAGASPRLASRLSSGDAAIGHSPRHRRSWDSRSDQSALEERVRGAESADCTPGFAARPSAHQAVNPLFLAELESHPFEGGAEDVVAGAHVASIPPGGDVGSSTVANFAGFTDKSEIIQLQDKLRRLLNTLDSTNREIELVNEGLPTRNWPIQVKDDKNVTASVVQEKDAAVDFLTRFDTALSEHAAACQAACLSEAGPPTHQSVELLKSEVSDQRLRIARLEAQTRNNPTPRHTDWHYIGSASEEVKNQAYTKDWQFVSAMSDSECASVRLGEPGSDVSSCPRKRSLSGGSDRVALGQQVSRGREARYSASQKVTASLERRASVTVQGPSVLSPPSPGFSNRSEGFPDTICGRLTVALPHSQGASVCDASTPCRPRCLPVLTSIGTVGSATAGSATSRVPLTGVRAASRAAAAVAASKAPSLSPRASNRAHRCSQGSLLEPASGSRAPSKGRPGRDDVPRAFSLPPSTDSGWVCPLPPAVTPSTPRRMMATTSPQVAQPFGAPPHCCSLDSAPTPPRTPNEFGRTGPRSPCATPRSLGTLHRTPLSSPRSHARDVLPAQGANAVRGVSEAPDFPVEERQAAACIVGSPSLMSRPQPQSPRSPGARGSPLPGQGRTSLPVRCSSVLTPAGSANLRTAAPGSPRIVGSASIRNAPASPLMSGSPRQSPRLLPPPSSGGRLSACHDTQRGLVPSVAAAVMSALMPGAPSLRSPAPAARFSSPETRVTQDSATSSLPGAFLPGTFTLGRSIAENGVTDSAFQPMWNLRRSVHHRVAPGVFTAETVSL